MTRHVMWLWSVSLLAFASVATAQAPQQRGVWVAAGQYDTPEKAELVVAAASRAHLNVLYAQVWCDGAQAWFQSSLCPMADGLAPGYDPLSQLIKLAHAKGIHVHAWFVIGNASWGHRNPVLEAHPDWAIVPVRPAPPGETWYDLAKPEVRGFIKNLMIDCLRRYPVDGLHFDFIRYNDQSYCYCDYCRSTFAQQYGLPVLPKGASLFPAVVKVSANPLAGPTTAQVLVEFDDGEPVIAVNRLGKGGTALLNVLTYEANPVMDAALKTLLQHLGATADGVYQLCTTETAANYPEALQVEAAKWLAAVGFPAKRVGEAELTQVPTSGTLVLYRQYCISEKVAEYLRRFVLAGGHCLFVDGPVRSMENEALQALTGFAGNGQWYDNRVRLAQPKPGQTIFETGPEVDLETEKTRQPLWVEWRKSTATELVRAVHEEAKLVRPESQVSAAVFPDRAQADSVCQDWYRWVREGAIDYVIPMAYMVQNDKLQAALDEYRSADPKLERIIPGLSLELAEGAQIKQRKPDLVLSQMDVIRKSGAQGVVLYYLADLNDELADALASGPLYDNGPPVYPQH